jgi:hypothetical protein
MLAACSSGHDTTTATTSRVSGERLDARAWSDKAAAAYKPLQLTGLQLPERVRAWQAGERSDDDVRADLATAAREVATVRDNVGRLPAFGRDARVAPLYRWSSLIYVEYVGASQAALDQPPGALRDQLVLLGRRLRVLGDRVFDRGQARLAVFLHQAADPNVEIRLPPEVPDWTADGLAAGPPLDEVPEQPDTNPALREEQRPTQARADWARALQSAGVPSDAELTSAIAAADQSRLRGLANRLAVIARDLAPVADPADPHGREDAAQARLALLIYGEAARAGQAALGDMAKRLVDVGDRVWAVPGLRPRS